MVNTDHASSTASYAPFDEVFDEAAVVSAMAPYGARASNGLDPAALLRDAGLRRVFSTALWAPTPEHLLALRAGRDVALSLCNTPFTVGFSRAGGAPASLRHLRADLVCSLRPGRQLAGPVARVLAGLAAAGGGSGGGGSPGTHPPFVAVHLRCEDDWRDALHSGVFGPNATAWAWQPSGHIIAAAQGGSPDGAAVAAALRRYLAAGAEQPIIYLLGGTVDAADVRLWAGVAAAVVPGSQAAPARVLTKADVLDPATLAALPRELAGAVDMFVAAHAALFLGHQFSTLSTRVQELQACAKDSPRGHTVMYNAHAVRRVGQWAHPTLGVMGDELQYLEELTTGP